MIRKIVVLTLIQIFLLSSFCFARVEIINFLPHQTIHPETRIFDEDKDILNDTDSKNIIKDLFLNLPLRPLDNLEKIKEQKEKINRSV